MVALDLRCLIVLTWPLLTLDKTSSPQIVCACCHEVVPHNPKVKLNEVRKRQSSSKEFVQPNPRQNPYTPPIIEALLSVSPPIKHDLNKESNDNILAAKIARTMIRES